MGKKPNGSSAVYAYLGGATLDILKRKPHGATALGDALPDGRERGRQSVEDALKALQQTGPRKGPERER